MLHQTTIQEDTRLMMQSQDVAVTEAGIAFTRYE